MPTVCVIKICPRLCQKQSERYINFPEGGMPPDPPSRHACILHITIILLPSCFPPQLKILHEILLGTKPISQFCLKVRQDSNSSMKLCALKYCFDYLLMTILVSHGRLLYTGSIVCELEAAISLIETETIYCNLLHSNLAS